MSARLAPGDTPPGESLPWRAVGWIGLPERPHRPAPTGPARGDELRRDDVLPPGPHHHDRRQARRQRRIPARYPPFEGNPPSRRGSSRDPRQQPVPLRSASELPRRVQRSQWDAAQGPRPGSRARLSLICEPYPADRRCSYLRKFSLREVSTCASLLQAGVAAVVEEMGAAFRLGRRRFGRRTADVESDTGSRSADVPPMRGRQGHKRAELLAGVRRRQKEIGAAVTARVDGIGDRDGPPELEYVEGLRSAIEAAIADTIDAADGDRDDACSVRRARAGAPRGQGWRTAGDGPAALPRRPRGDE